MHWSSLCSSLAIHWAKKSYSAKTRCSGSDMLLTAIFCRRTSFCWSFVGCSSMCIGALRALKNLQIGFSYWFPIYETGALLTLHWPLAWKLIKWSVKNACNKRGRWKCETWKCTKENSALGCPICRTDITFMLNWTCTEVTELLNCLNRALCKTDLNT